MKYFIWSWFKVTMLLNTKKELFLSTPFYLLKFCNTCKKYWLKLVVY